ncbi:MAG TPA: hypothetical protein PL117_07405 [Accumulibacter sp.]|uniref:hypothetical protein n=1 Tax=Accumulibacter sp. TaxID=2053492 RepID=UPI000ECDDDED|nr:hypothetical protein [Accumulibacter sp.]HCZ16023.1 hypothetical protein [Accumulibacter sp.]HRF72581.1 hypothetical protein [Accumulibacter sp.]
MTTEDSNADALKAPPALAAATSSAQLRGRLTLLAIIAVCVLPLLAALYFRYLSPPELTATVGESIDPVPLPFEWLQTTDGQPLQHPEVGGKWLLILAAPGGCDARCEHTLYLTRQARTAQGRNIARLDRLWLITDSTKPAAQLLAEHPDLLLVKATDDKVLEALGGRDSRHINLIDRRGLVVFRYADDPDPKAFIRELGKLIRF